VPKESSPLDRQIEPGSDQDLVSAIELLRHLLPDDELNAYSLRHSPATVYTVLTTLWMLTLQRLGGGTSLKTIVKETLTHHSEIFPDNKRVREGTLSTNPSAFSDARLRIPVSSAERFLDQVSQSIMDAVPERFDDRRTFIIDGTTFKLAPTSELREAFPPSTNQHGEAVWPILLLSVAHDLESGAALRPEFGAMYGSKNTSEAKHAISLAKRIPAGSVVLADSGYGIFNVVDAMLGSDHDILFRMTKARFKSLSRHAEQIDSTATSDRYRLNWEPSRKDLKKNPHLSPQRTWEVELHRVALPSGEELYLVTSMVMSSEKAAEGYSHRYGVEHDIRDLKVTLNLESIRARSEEMVKKEMLCSMVAYNLVIQLRRQAAKQAGVSPRRMSFKGVWDTMSSCLLHQTTTDAATWQDRYQRALDMACRSDKLPLRPGRSFPRRAHAKAAKWTPYSDKNKSSNNSKTNATPESG
jgi:hypothetical protein